MAGERCWRLPGVDCDAAPIFWCDIVERLGKRPAMPRWVKNRALPLPVRKVLGLTEDDAATPTDPVAQGNHVVDPQHH